MFTVFHLTFHNDHHIWFECRTVEGARPYWEKRSEHYRAVAQVDCKLEEVFDNTNHGAPGIPEEGWQKNPLVTMLVPESVRSTSVGDVVVDEVGRAWLCKPMGWGRL
jgi:hypothetical protein